VTQILDDYVLYSDYEKFLVTVENISSYQLQIKLLET